MNTHGIKNYLFDLGNVLLDIDIERSKKAFKLLGLGDLMTHFYTTEQAELINDYEKGMVTTSEFCSIIRQRSGKPVNDEAILMAWNEIIGEYRIASIRFLQQLKQNHKVYLLSNTNQCHYQYFTRLFSALGMGNFDQLFDKAFYSHEIGLRKPDSVIYEHVLSKAEIKASETLFIDDLSINTEAAARLGIKTLLLKEGMRVEEELRK